jgi:poly(hydroxyalkanoate) depolymerase family esterase
VQHQLHERSFMAIPMEEMLRATALTRSGNLKEATLAIQRALGLVTPQTTPQPAPRHPHQPVGGDAVDVAFREISPAGDKGPGAQPDVAPTPTAPPAGHSSGTFTKDHFVSNGERYVYRLYIPAGVPPGQPIPVMVMLHGCKQDSADFARGTGMNTLADEHKFMVLYPEQRQKANAMRCWNWFEPAHQQRGKGEPAMIAALVAHVLASHPGDAARVYVAGLSAGGAMAALAGQLYPDVFAAVGVHSGLAPGAAADMPGAFSAMRKGRKGKAALPATGAASPPTIVFHGTADTTVHPGNADHVLDAALAGLRASGLALNEVQDTGAGATPGSRNARRTAWVTPDGTPVLEHWAVATGPHAWSGGSAAGSFTDPQGPSASQAMVAFFLRHRRAV